VSELERRRGEADAALFTAEEKERDLECALVLALKGQGTATVRASYLVSCAVWRPAYRATLKGESVLLEAEAVVWQRTGETWKDVQLAGPVDLIRQAGFVGSAQLAFAAPGETVKLAFGSEDGLSVVREVQEQADEARLTGRRTVTTKVRLHVSNARPEPAKLVLEERVPVSEVKEVEVQVLTKECSPAPSTVTKDGIARIELELPPHGTRTAVFAWELSAAAKVAGL
jgi:hypothetical protein